MPKYHKLQLSDNRAFGDNLKFLECSQCSRKMAVEIDRNGILLLETVKVINQGNIFALHKFIIGFSNFTTNIAPNIGPIA